MVSLVDIGPLTKMVPIRGNEVQVRGVSALMIFDLLTKSNELRLIFAQRAIDADVVAALIQQAPEAVAEIIAAATGKQGDPATIAFALTELGAGETALFLNPIIELTFPQGIQSFVDGLADLARKAGGRGWGAGTKSPEQSSAASAPATTSTDAGDTRPDNSPPGPS